MRFFIGLLFLALIDPACCSLSRSSTLVTSRLKAGQFTDPPLFWSSTGKCAPPKHGHITCHGDALESFFSRADKGQIYDCGRLPFQEAFTLPSLSRTVEKSPINFLCVVLSASSLITGNPFWISSPCVVDRIV